MLYFIKIKYIILVVRMASVFVCDSCCHVTVSTDLQCHETVAPFVFKLRFS